MKIITRFLVFAVINFSALGLGTILMGNGATSSWYQQLNKAPWTPEGWVFGAAWFTVMLCFSAYMAYLYQKQPTKKVVALFALQWTLNVCWNFFFFNQELIDIALINILILTLIVLAFFVTYMKDLKLKSVFVVPYAVWILIATSLNLYISIFN